MKLLLTTPRSVLHLDLDRGVIEPVLAGDTYGVSWSSSFLALLHSRDDPPPPADPRDPHVPSDGYLTFHTGAGSWRSAPDLLAGHQIECVGDHVLTANTGRNALSVFGPDGALRRQVHPVPGVTRDFGPDGPCGHHFNSVHRTGARVWLVAHNHARRSQVWELDWPSLETVRVLDTRATWAHNVWPCDLGLIICDTGGGTLLDAETGACVWRADEDVVLTRGLAATADYIVVGRSTLSPRASRADSDGGLWLLDRQTLATLEKVVLEGSGVVREVRILDRVDECHNGVPFDPAWLDHLRGLPGRRAPAPRTRLLAGRHRSRPRGPWPPGGPATAGRPALAAGSARAGARGLRVCVWAPLLSAGGGVRLLTALAGSLARHPGVSRLRLAAPREGLPATLAGADAVELVPLDVPASGPRRVPVLAAERRILGIPGTGRLRHAWRRRAPGWDVSTLRRVAADCDVVWCPWPHLQPFPESRVPLVTTVQDMIVFDYPEILGPAATRSEWSRLRAWLAGSDTLVVSSAATRTAMVRHFGGQYVGAHLIPHAIVPALAGQAVLDGQAGTGRPRLPGPYVVYPANLSPHKNHHNLFLAWNAFSRRREVRLVLLGPGTSALTVPGPPWATNNVHAARLAATLSRLEIAVGHEIDVAGYVPDADAHRLIAGADALVMPSLAEGGGSFPVEEALAAGVPVLCSDIPVMREHLRERTARIAWFDPHCPGAITGALETLFADYGDHKARAVRGTADPRPSWDDVAGRYVAVFRAAVEAGP